MTTLAGLKRSFKFNFAEAFSFLWKVADLAEPRPTRTSGSVGRPGGFSQTKKIKGLHENDFIVAAKLDRIAAEDSGL